VTRCSFTLEEYRDYLALAVAEGYRFVGFESLAEASDLDEPQILLRHDIDYDPRFMPPMAAIEADLGVRATYCIQVDSRWYSVGARDNRAAIAATLDAGHWLGLHLDASEIQSDGEVSERAIAQVRQLSQEFGRDVRVVSFHMPGRRRVGHIALGNGLVNTYDRRFFDDIGYVSDSNQNWRGVDLEAVLRGHAHDRLQLLVHPFWWRSEPASMRRKMQRLSAELGIDMHDIVTPEQWQLMEEQEAAAA
jgi:hypothetical protein